MNRKPGFQQSIAHKDVEEKNDSPPFFLKNMMSLIYNCFACVDRCEHFLAQNMCCHVIILLFCVLLQIWLSNLSDLLARYDNSLTISFTCFIAK